MRIVVLGGAGKMGCISVQSLTKDPRVDEVVIADFNPEQAKVVAETIDTQALYNNSVERRARVKTMVRASCLTSAAASVAASPPAPRRFGAAPFVTGGFHIANTRRPRGASPPFTWMTFCLVSFPTNSTGFPTVALVTTHCGVAP